MIVTAAVLAAFAAWLAWCWRLGRRYEVEQQRDEARARCTTLEMQLEQAYLTDVDQVRSFWMAVAQRNADEAEAYAAQLRSLNAMPNRDFPCTKRGAA